MSLALGDAMLDVTAGGIVKLQSTVDSLGGLAQAQQLDLEGYKIGYVLGYATSPKALAATTNPATGAKLRQPFTFRVLAAWNNVYVLCTTSALAPNACFWIT